MPFRYAAFTVMMPEYELAAAAALLSELGYQGVEWRVHSVPKDMPSQPDFWRGNRATIDIGTITQSARDVKKLSEDHGLTIIGLGTYLSYKLLSDVERCMEAARTMGCGSIRVSAAKYDGSENYNDMYEEAVEGYAQVEELARKYGVRANIEIHHGSICSSASLAYRLVSNFDPDYLGVIMDPGNMVFEGYENWQLGLELLGPYLSYVHVKNSATTRNGSLDDGTAIWKPAVVPMKEGAVSWREVIMALNKVGYRGWMSFEDFAPGETKVKLTEDLGYMRTLEAELGI